MDSRVNSLHSNFSQLSEKLGNLNFEHDSSSKIRRPHNDLGASQRSGRTDYDFCANDDFVVRQLHNEMPQSKSARFSSSRTKMNKVTPQLHKTANNIYISTEFFKDHEQFDLGMFHGLFKEGVGRTRSMTNMNRRNVASTEGYRLQARTPRPN